MPVDGLVHSVAHISNRDRSNDVTRSWTIDHGALSATALRGRGSTVFSLLIASRVFLMHEDGIVAEVCERIQQAGLIPPVKAVIWQGSKDNPPKESVLIDVTGPVSPELEAQLSDVLSGLAHEVRSVPPGHGILYGRGPGEDPAR